MRDYSPPIPYKPTNKEKLEELIGNYEIIKSVRAEIAEGLIDKGHLSDKLITIRNKIVKLALKL